MKLFKYIALMMLCPMFLCAQPKEDFFSETVQFDENVKDDLSQIYHYCQYRIMDCEKEMKNTKKTSIYSIYQAKREAYIDVREQILKY